GLQETRTGCVLRSIFFADPQNGWAVGGWTHPYTHKSTGVILRTKDGGRSWTSVAGLNLPALSKVKFFDANRGWAVGNNSTTYTSGVFRTSDGGRSWASLPSGQRDGWTTGDFRDATTGAVAGERGRLGMVMSNGVQPTRTPAIGSRPLHRLQLVGGSSGWLIGDAGLAMQTRDGGLSWTSPDVPLPLGAHQLDLHALAIYGENVWIAGDPGTVIYHSPDYGRSWQTIQTGQKMNLRGMTFVDKQYGWAVGSLGTILATSDGGQTWRRQRSGGLRAAVLGIFSEASKIPLPLLSKVAADDGYLTAIELIGNRSIMQASEAEATESQRTRGAVIASGATALHSDWRFPLRQRGLKLKAEDVVRGWDFMNDGRSIQILEERLVSRIRQWRPEIIITEPADPRGHDPLAHVTNQVVLSAVRHAADATQFTEQLTELGLEPWSVKKVFSSISNGEQGNVNISTTQLLPRFGKSIADHASHAAGLMNSEYRQPPATLGFRMLVSHLAQQPDQRGFFAGINLVPGGDARRKTIDEIVGNMETLRFAAQKRRNIQRMMELEQSVQDGSWLGQVGDLTDGLNTQSAGDILFQLAVRYHESGKSDAAAQVYQMLADRYPDHPLAESALLWMVQYYASGEASWLQRKANYIGFKRGAAPSHASDLKLAEVKPEIRGRDVMFDTLKPNERIGHALALANRIKQTRPALYTDPRMRFPLGVAQQQLGHARDAERFYHSFTSQHPESDWASSARTELWLQSGQGPPPKPLTLCYRSNAKPYLDGRLDDPIWQTAKPVNISSLFGDDEKWPGGAVLAYDDEFLYVGVSCRKAAQATYTMSDSPRSHDADLSSNDRVELLLDIDRDYSSFYRLTVDHQGWTAEECLGDKTWNPQWFVAANSDELQWTVEFAVPWSQLAPSAPRVNDAWAVGVQRVVPGVGFQSWSQPAAAKPRAEGMGILLFQ
ncbi:MAG: photosystem II stability/assembly factor-like uncharacterized protein/TolA-binding protein, partial [Pirellulaceae bacterium]